MKTAIFTLVLLVFSYIVVGILFGWIKNRKSYYIWTERFLHYCEMTISAFLTSATTFYLWSNGFLGENGKVLVAIWTVGALIEVLCTLIYFCVHAEIITENLGWKDFLEDQFYFWS